MTVTDKAASPKVQFKVFINSQVVGYSLANKKMHSESRNGLI